MIEHNMLTMAGINGFFYQKIFILLFRINVMCVTRVITCSMVRKNQEEAIMSYGIHAGKWQDRSVVTVSFCFYSFCFLKDRVVVP